MVYPRRRRQAYPPRRYQAYPRRHIVKVGCTVNQNEAWKMNGVGVQLKSFHNNLMREPHRFTLQHSHPHRVRSYALDDEQQATLFQAHEMSLSLEEYLATLEPPVYHFTIPDSMEEGFFVSDDYKKIIKDAIQYISDQHKLGKCVGAFNANNVVFVNGEIKFGATRMPEYSQAAMELDYMCLADMADYVLFRDVDYEGFPHDMVELLELLRGIKKWPRNEGKRKSRIYLLTHHVALMSAKELETFFNRSVKSGIWLQGTKYYRSYKKAVEDTDIDFGWQSNISEYSPLQRIHKQYGNTKRFKFDMLRYFRNTVEHLGEDPCTTVPRLEEGDPGRILMLTFPSVASSFQFQLARHGVLRRVMEEKENDDDDDCYYGYDKEKGPQVEEKQENEVHQQQQVEEEKQENQVHENENEAMQQD